MMRSISIHLIFCSTTAQHARLDAYATPPAARSSKPGRTLSAALTAPKLDWDAHQGSLPETVESTSHYSVGQVAKPGAFSVARREPWLLPAQHKRHQPHPSDSPEVDPHGANRHDSRPDSAGSASWHTDVSNAEHLQPRGLPAQKPADWPMPPRRELSHAPGSYDVPGMAAAAADQSSQAVAARMHGGNEPPVGGNEPVVHDEASEWGAVKHSAARNNETAGVATADLPLPTAHGTQPAVAASLPAGASGHLQEGTDPPRGSQWWSGERKVKSWRLVSLATKLSSSGRSSSSAAVAAAANASDEVEWQHASSPRAGAAAPVAEAAGAKTQPVAVPLPAAPAAAVAVGARDAPLTPGSAASLAEGETGGVYEVQYR